MTTPLTLQMTQIVARLAAYRPQVLLPGERGHAAVNLVVREAGAAPEVLFIVRAEHDRDPWSGNIGFPGGRLDHDRETARQAALREAREELSLNLERSRYLGRLDDLRGATLPVLVSCFVYQLCEPAPLRPNEEVADTFWCSLSRLLEAERHRMHSFSYRGRQHPHPVVELLPPPAPPLWGITYRLVRNFFAVCGIEFGRHEPLL
jgi:8-oxo-dGTP pyrophosphatase MutT (NUDIX family)